MSIEETKRMICKSEMIIQGGHIVPPQVDGAVDETEGSFLLNMTPVTGMDYGFRFYDKATEKEICFISFHSVRRKYEIIYETHQEYRNKGYMSEALDFFIKWIFANTSVDKMYALINDNDISQKILKKVGFVLEKEDEFGKWFYSVYNASEILTLMHLNY